MTNSNCVWGVFVGEGGCLLQDFNSQHRPYPPIENDEGWVAIGWGRVGAMEMYESNYKLFETQFFKVYPGEKPIQASEVWRFAYEIKVGDWVISPSAATGFLLVGEITSPYISNHDGDFQFEYYRHIRKVKWLYIIPKSDPRYTQLNRIGQLAVAKLNRTIAEVKNICETK